MLIEFSVKNFRSIRDEQTLSLVASNYYTENREVLIDTKLPGLAKTSLLPCAVVFGANASGKSTLIYALATLKNIVLTAFNADPGKALPYVPFALDTTSSSAATEFSVVFTADGVRYAYMLSYGAGLVLEESLAAYPNGKEQLWFYRSFDAEKHTTSYKPNARYLKVPADIIDVLREDVPFLSMLIKLNYPSIKPLAKWFAEGLAVVDRGPEVPQDLLRQFSTNMLKGSVGNAQMRNTLMNMIKRADFGILDGQVVPVPAPEISDEIKKMLPDGLFDNMKDAEWEAIQFAHQGKEASQFFSIDAESAGTRRLFELAGPIADVLESAKTVVIDELDSSMHPLLVNEIIRLFQSHITNTNGAQLICTVHSTSTMEKGLLRRDQIWFTKKRRYGSTDLYPLSDYKPRKDESVEASYLTGRYDAIPVIPELFGYRWGAADQ
jgi:hypothetical protein